MGHESLIMQQSDIGAISRSVKDCLRCGKCKPVCATHVPRANLLYSPRNKILATSLLVEAFLYEEQTRRGVSTAALGRLRGRGRPLHGVPQVRRPCPVNIDFGDVTMNMRNLLRKMGKELPPRQCRGGDVHAQRHQPADHQADARTAMVAWGFKAQRLAVGRSRPAWPRQTASRRPPGARPRSRSRSSTSSTRSCPAACPKDRARLLDIEDKAYVPIIIRPATTADRRRSSTSPAAARAPVQPGRPGHAGHAVACRRADRAAAGYLCCGYPQRGSGQFDKAER